MLDSSTVVGSSVWKQVLYFAAKFVSVVPVGEFDSRFVCVIIVVVASAHVCFFMEPCKIHQLFIFGVGVRV